MQEPPMVYYVFLVNFVVKGRNLVSFCLKGFIENR